MATPTDPRLQQARRLLQLNQHQQARVLLNAILQDDSRNVEALLLYARVARSPEEQSKVLERVLRLDPGNVQARTALDALGSGSDALSSSAAPPAARPSRPLATTSPAPDDDALEAASTGMGAGAMIAALLVLGLLLVAVVIGVLALMQDEEVADQPPTSTLVPTNPGIVIGSGGSGQILAELPITWTPGPTDPPPATLTKAPSATRRPSTTPFPTFSPTPLETLEVNPDVSSMSRLYNDYIELAVQAAFTDSPAQLADIASALEALITSVNNSNYQRDPAFLPSWRNYLDEYRLMVAQQYALITGDESVLPVFENAATEEPSPSPDPDSTEEVNLFLLDGVDVIVPTAVDLENRVIQQQQLVEALLSRLIRDDRATRTFEQQVESLKTPSVTPIVVPPPSN